MQQNAISHLLPGRPAKILKFELGIDFTEHTRGKFEHVTKIVCEIGELVESLVDANQIVHLNGTALERVQRKYFLEVLYPCDFGEILGATDEKKDTSNPVRTHENDEGNFEALQHNKKSDG